MRLVLISDTHGHHRRLKLPQGDMLIHAGDICNYGDDKMFWDFLDWLKDLDFQQVLFVGGNHDLVLERFTRKHIESRLPAHVKYLENESFFWRGIHFWASPEYIKIPGFAFGKPRDQMAAHWAQIPANTDVLITHGPPQDILYVSRFQKTLGCSELQNKVFGIKPQLHVFGHVHNSYGQQVEAGVHFVNASILNSEKGPVNQPIIFEL